MKIDWKLLAIKSVNVFIAPLLLRDDRLFLSVIYLNAPSARQRCLCHDEWSTEPAASEFINVARDRLRRKLKPIHNKRNLTSRRRPPVKTLSSSFTQVFPHSVSTPWHILTTSCAHTWRRVPLVPISFT